MASWQWAETHFKPIGSARSDRFSISITPWLKEPFKRCEDGITRELTFIGPAQCGKSVLGEAMICYWIATDSHGDIQFNWETDGKSRDRFKRRVRKVMEACNPVQAMWPVARHNVSASGLIIFPHLNFTMQGVFQQINVESESVRRQVNEELHEWEAGRKGLAAQRVRAHWDSFVLNLSTGGTKGDQLYQCWQQGGRQRWMVPCPECGKYQALFQKREEGKAGGLVYDGDTCKQPDGRYNYDELAESLHYECEYCLTKIPDERGIRRSMAERGKWSRPEDGSSLLEASYQMEAVSVYWVPWLSLIKDHHRGVSALRHGDIEPLKTHIQRNEGGFWDPEDRPIQGVVELSDGLLMGEPMEDRAFRIMTIDVQKDHFWAVVRDWSKESDSRLLVADQFSSYLELETMRKELQIRAPFVFIDSGYKATEVYRICAKYNWTPIKGEAKDYYLHPVIDRKDRKLGTVRRIYSEPTEIDPWEGTIEGGRVVIMLLRYSKQGIRDRLDYLRAGGARWEVPEDVGMDYRAQMEAEELQEQHSAHGDVYWVWVTVKRKNHLFVCEAYQVLAASIAGLSGGGMGKADEALASSQDGAEAIREAMSAQEGGAIIERPENRQRV